MPIFKEFYILTSHINSKRKEQVIITYLNENEEKKLDDNNQITLKRGKTTFHIHMNNIYCYGEVDLRKGSNDCVQIADFDFLDYLGMKGIVIPSDYDYEHHECHSPLKSYRWTETWRPDVLVRFAHGSINKPKRIILFKRLL